MKSNWLPVVIVGAGPVGLALAIELGSRGISCILLERNEREGWAPRAKTTHTRTRALMRRWGIADDLAKASPFGVDYPVDIHFMTQLSGYRLVRFADALNCSPGRDERYPEHGQWVPQYKLESVLRAKVLKLPCVELRSGVEFAEFEQQGHRLFVHQRCVVTGEQQIIEAEYLVGADGARSMVREKIGAKMIGKYGLSRNYNVIFEAPGLADAHSQGPGVIYWQINPDVPSIICPMDEGDLWAFGPAGLPDGKILTDDEAITMIKQSTGIDLPYRILSTDLWIASRLISDSYRQGPVFLAGDACHLHPPFGGFGMNMGIADAVDLGWKIAAVRQGWGGTILLDSYEIERRPIHEMVMDEAERNHSTLPTHLLRKGILEDTPEGAAIRAEVAAHIEQSKRGEFYALGIVLGLRTCGSPVILDEGVNDNWSPSRDYVPSAVPGSLAPHAWLSDGRSLYDLFGDGFTLLVLATPETGDIERARREAVRTGTPLQIVILPDPELEKLYEASRALIRPDQLVAWRGNEWPETDLLLFATGRLEQGASSNHTLEAGQLSSPIA